MKDCANISVNCHKPEYLIRESKGMENAALPESILLREGEIKCCPWRNGDTARLQRMPTHVGILAMMFDMGTTVCSKDEGSLTENSIVLVVNLYENLEVTETAVCLPGKVYL